MNCPSCSEDGCVVEMQPDPTAEGRLTCPLCQYTELPRRGIDIPARQCGWRFRHPPSSLISRGRERCLRPSLFWRNLVKFYCDEGIRITSKI